MINLENNDENNQMVTAGTKRLKIISASVFADVHWEVISDLLTSPLEQNSFLASEMIIEKSKRSTVPVEMIVLLLKDNHQNIRENGLKLLDVLSYSQALTYFESLLQLLNSNDINVVQALFKLHLKTANTEKTKIITERLLYRLMHQESFEGAHELFKNHLFENCQQPLRIMPSTFIVKLLFAKQKEAQNLGTEMLYQRTDFSDFSLQQIMALGNHEVYRVRQWVWSFFNNNKGFVKLNKTQALQILDSHWDDTRAFAFHYFEENYEENDWDVDTLVGLVDAVRPDVENFGKNLIQKYFHQADAWQKIYKLSQHPTLNIQLFVTNYLEEHIKDDLKQIKQLDYFFRSVLTRVNQARVAKNRLFSFLEKRALISEAHAFYIGQLLDDISALASIQDKAKCIDLLTEIKWAYPSFESHLILK